MQTVLKCDNTILYTNRIATIKDFVVSKKINYVCIALSQNKFILSDSPIAVNFSKCVRRGSHRGGSLQDVLGDERTCGTTLASAYVLRRLSAAWSQLQMKERSPSGSEC